MLKKFFILGLLLLFVGTAVFSWLFTRERKEQQQVTSYQLKYALEADEYLKQYDEWLKLAPEEQPQLLWGLDRYGKTKTRAQIRQEQQERLKADLDRLATGEMDVYPFAHILYGENWRKELSKYKMRKELKEYILTGSIVCTSIGGTILTWCLLLWMARLFIRVPSYLKKLLAGSFNSREKAKGKQPVEPNVKEDKKNSEQQQESHEQQIRSRKRSKVLINSGWHNFEMNLDCRQTSFANQQESAQPQTQLSMRSETYPDDLAKNAGETAFLFSDEKSIECEESLNAATENLNVNVIQPNHLRRSAQKTALLACHENSLKLEDSLKTQTENLEKQVAEFRQIAQTVKQTSLEHSEPLNNTLSELVQQVAAIREYASQQQDKVKKLQDGYDWNIIRNFCLRIIRCIDNLENRINCLSKQDIETVNLKEARDELVFALESSGVERFEPVINSDYHGQEKIAEAVKDKEYSDDPNLAGKIAKVIRPGYQYSIDEENVKVVRTAQVKLFG
jgi:molecular chaperone GrpE (heat shock protein)